MSISGTPSDSTAPAPELAGPLIGFIDPNDLDDFLFVLNRAEGLFSIFYGAPEFGDPVDYGSHGKTTQLLDMPNWASRLAEASASVQPPVPQPSTTPPFWAASPNTRAGRTRGSSRNPSAKIRKSQRRGSR